MVVIDKECTVIAARGWKITINVNVLQFIPFV